ncbi:MAG: EamA family transporter [Rikenellaceae bacterium]
MKSLKYNLSLLIANALFALNFSLFVSVMESKLLSIDAIYLLESLGLLFVTTTLRIYRREASPPIQLSDTIIITLTSILSTLGWSYATLWGMSLTSPIDAATIASVGPSLTLLFAHFMGRRSLTGVRIAGLVISLMGVVILVISHPSGVVSTQANRGNLLLLCAVIIAAINTLIFKPQLERYGVIRVAHIYAIAAAAINLPLFAKSLGQLITLSVSWVAATELTLLLLIGCALPLLLLFEGTEYLSALHTSLYRYTQPLIAAIVVLSRGQATLTAANIVAMVVLIAGGILVAQGVDRSD